jgi:hypothetical protein
MVSYVRGRRRILSDAEIVRLYLAGDDSGTVGLLAGCDPTTVLTLVRCAGGTVRKPGGCRKPDLYKLADAEICRRYQSGISGPEIADAADCAVSSIYSVLRRYGVERRDARQIARAASAVARGKRLRTARRSPSSSAPP